MIISYPKPGTYVVRGRSWRLSKVRFATPAVYHIDTVLANKTKVRYEVLSAKLGRLYVDDTCAAWLDLAHGGLAAIADLRVRVLVEDALAVLSRSAPTQEMIAAKLHEENRVAAEAEAKNIADAIRKL